eukprot:scaffold689_cov375-Prasinococcus_capsulatus_cf.AAC.20
MAPPTSVSPCLSTSGTSFTSTALGGLRMTSSAGALVVCSRGASSVTCGASKPPRGATGGAGGSSRRGDVSLVVCFSVEQLLLVLGLVGMHSIPSAFAGVPVAAGRRVRGPCARVVGELRRSY